MDPISEQHRRKTHKHTLIGVPTHSHSQKYTDTQTQAYMLTHHTQSASHCSAGHQTGWTGQREAGLGGMGGRALALPSGAPLSRNTASARPNQDPSTPSGGGSHGGAACLLGRMRSGRLRSGPAGDLPGTHTIVSRSLRLPEGAEDPPPEAPLPARAPPRPGLGTHRRTRASGPLAPATSGLPAPGPPRAFEGAGRPPAPPAQLGAAPREAARSRQCPERGGPAAARGKGARGEGQRRGGGERK